MKTTRSVTIAAVALSATMLFTGCASGGAGSATTTAAAGADCMSLRSAVRDISNGAQNTLAASIADAASQKTAEDYLGTLSDRLGSLESKWQDNQQVKSALTTFGDKINAAKDYVTSVPTDGSAPDANAETAASTGIRESALAASDSCKV